MRAEGACGVSANEYIFAHGAQINFGDLTPYFTYACMYSITTPQNKTTQVVDQKHLYMTYSHLYQTIIQPPTQWSPALSWVRVGLLSRAGIYAGPPGVIP
jgi:hypothetical protein